MNAADLNVSEWYPHMYQVFYKDGSWDVCEIDWTRGYVGRVVREISSLQLVDRVVCVRDDGRIAATRDAHRIATIGEIDQRLIRFSEQRTATYAAAKEGAQAATEGRAVMSDDKTDLELRLQKFAEREGIEPTADVVRALSAAYRAGIDNAPHPSWKPAAEWRTAEFVGLDFGGGAAFCVEHGTEYKRTYGGNPTPIYYAESGDLRCCRCQEELAPSV